MSRALPTLAGAMGVSCLAIGTLHLALGIESVPGEEHAGATVDSRERYYAAIFGGYGAAWIWAARQDPVPTEPVRWLSWTFLIGGLGRLVSWKVHGRPHWFQVVLTAVELVLPPVFLRLVDAEERNSLLVPEVPAPGSEGRDERDGHGAAVEAGGDHRRVRRDLGGDQG